MTCTTCHDPHQNQRGRTDIFTNVCLTCHQSQDCGAADRVGESISADCVSCHMPRSQNQDMKDVMGEDLDIQMADHFIQINDEATERFLATPPTVQASGD